jgi:hypothetical protein
VLDHDHSPASAEPVGLEIRSQRISAAEFVRELTGLMCDDIFWSNYSPSWGPLRPLFAKCRGIDEIVARYDYENEHEVIEHGSGVPFDIAVVGDTLYYAQRETASFFGRPRSSRDRRLPGT